MRTLFMFFICLVLSTASTEAQPACDSLSISVRYDPFQDSLIGVNVINNSQELFSYPGFILFDAAGDTVAKETVNFFGLAQYSYHVLDLYPGMPPSDSFGGELQLWTWFYDSLACGNSGGFDLCPHTCVTVYPFLGNMGSANINGSYNWLIRTGPFDIVASGSFALDSSSQVAQDTVCLNPGNYQYEVHLSTGGGGGQPVIGLNAYNDFSTGLQAPFTGSTASLPFQFFKKCIPVNSIGGPQPSRGPAIVAGGRNLHIGNNTGKPLGRISVYSMEGRIVFDSIVREAEAWADLSGLPGGIYLVRVSGNGLFQVEKIFLD